MKTIEITLYKFSELSEKAQQKAIQEQRKQNWKYGYSWAEEAHKSLQEFCEAFNLDYQESNFSTNATADVRTSTIEDDILNLKGKRLVAYLVNNYGHLLYERKHYGEYKKRSNGKYSYDWYSRCQQIQTCCPFTGYAMDESLLNPIRDYIKKADASTTFEDLIKDCVNKWIKDAREDCEYQESDEYIIEQIEANEYDFTEDGEQY